MQTPASTAAKASAITPQPPTSASPLPVKERAGVQPIAALNPYDTNVSEALAAPGCTIWFACSSYASVCERRQVGMFHLQP